MQIVVPERGNADIDGQTWNALIGHRDFWRLLDQKMLTAQQVAPNKIRLTGSCFVGRVLLGGLTLDLCEKIDGSLAALLGHATHSAFRIEQYNSQASAMGPLLALLLRQFLDVLRTYISQGRECRYETQHLRGSLVGGRIDITRTTVLRARGLQHVLAFDRPLLTHVTPKNRLLAAAIKEVERIADIITLSTTDLAMARGLSLLFQDCRDSEVLFGNRDAFVRTAQQLIGAPNSQDRDLLALASVILAHQSFDYSSPINATIPRAWFLNLEKLFEVAVRNVLKQAYAPGIVTTRAEVAAPSTIFQHATESYKANPDLVLSAQQRIAAIGDVKYKTWTANPNQDDLFQLLVHAAAYHSETAFLIYPNDTFVARDLGASYSSGETIWPGFGVKPDTVGHERANGTGAPGSVA